MDRGNYEDNISVSIVTNAPQLTLQDAPTKTKVNIWGYELCNGAQWKDFLEVVNKLGKENEQLKQQLAEKEVVLKCYKIEERNIAKILGDNNANLIMIKAYVERLINEVKHKNEEISKLQASCQQDKDQRIAELEQKFADLQEKAIVPKFKVGQKVWMLELTDTLKNKIAPIELVVIAVSQGSVVATPEGYPKQYFRHEKNEFVYTTKEQAEKKLQELRGGE